MLCYIMNSIIIIFRCRYLLSLLQTEGDVREDVVQARSVPGAVVAELNPAL